MDVKAKIYKHNEWWVVDCEVLGIHTQGKSEINAVEMLYDAIQEVSMYRFNQTLNNLTINKVEDSYVVSSSDQDLLDDLCN